MKTAVTPLNFPRNHLSSYTPTAVITVVSTKPPPEVAAQLRNILYLRQLCLRQSIEDFTEYEQKQE